MTDPTPVTSPVIVDASGRPARAAIETKCPVCRSARRRLSGGFGPVHDICADCGHAWPDERTADE
jgi:uncharacterized protein (DUF983 family)